MLHSVKRSCRSRLFDDPRRIFEDIAESSDKVVSAASIQIGETFRHLTLATQSSIEQSGGNSDQARGTTPDHFSGALGPDYRSIFCNHPPPGNGRDRPSCYLKSFPRRIVRTVMQIGLPDRFLQLGIPQHDVGVEAHTDRTLARIKTINSRVISGSQLDEFLETDPSLRHALREEDRQARFYPRDSVWYPAKRCTRIRRQFALRIVVAKRAMIGRKGLKDA